MAKVLKRFPYAANGHTVEILNEGDERDFGSATQGLIDEGYIEGVADVVEPVAPVAVEPVAVEAAEVETATKKKK